MGSVRSAVVVFCSFSLVLSTSDILLFFRAGALLEFPYCARCGRCRVPITIIHTGSVIRLSFRDRRWFVFAFYMLVSIPRLREFLTTIRARETFKLVVDCENMLRE